MAAISRTVVSLYWIGDIVFLRVNDERKRGMVTRVNIVAHDAVSYGVTWCGGSETWHYECELTAEYLPDFSTIESSGEASA